jgi:predicted PurR-regulated permease PerM
MEQRKRDRIVVRYLIMAAAVVLGIRYFEEILSGIGFAWHLAFPLIQGAVIAYVLNLVLKVVERFYFPNSTNRAVKKTKRAVCILISLLLIAAALVFIFQMVIPELISAFGVIGQGLPAFFENVKDFILKNSEQFPEVQIWVEEQVQALNWADLTRNLFNYVTSGLSNLVSSTIYFLTVVFGGVIQFCLSLIFAIYILANKEKLASQGNRILKAYLKETTVSRIQYVLGTAHTVFSNFIGGQCTEAVILGSLCAAGMWIFRFPYAPMVGAFVGVTALIPIVGAYLGAAVGAFMIVTVDPLQALFFVVFLVILQQLEGNLIYPRVMGASIGLPGMWVLAAVTVGGGLGGIVGMLLSVPAAATLYRLLKTDVAKRSCPAAAEEKEG